MHYVENKLVPQNNIILLGNSCYNFRGETAEMENIITYLLIYNCISWSTQNDLLINNKSIYY